MTDVEQLRPEADLSGLSNADLLLAHAELHSFWKEIESGREIEEWDKHSLIRLHKDVREQLSARNLPHQELNGLDDEQVVHEMKVQFEPVEQRSYEQVGDSFVEDWR